MVNPSRMPGLLVGVVVGEHYDAPMPREFHADAAVVGGGLGGCAAALTLARSGRSVVLTEETGWLGGQLTTQAVPPDEHPWVEQFGCTASYRALREAIRAYYRRWYPLRTAARGARHLNPGAGWVSTLCHEPRVAVAVLDGLLAPHRSAGRVRVLTGHRPVAAEAAADRVRAVTLQGPDGEAVSVTAAYVLDATETGELLPLAGAEHVSGAESHHDTGEPHAPREAQPHNQQAATHCFVLEHRAGADHTIDRPADYERLRQARPAGWPGPQLAWTAPDPKTGQPVTHRLEPNPDDDPAAVTVDMTAPGSGELWTFRRIAARRLFTPGSYPSDLTVVNWPMADYVAGPLYGRDDAEEHRRGVRELSRCLLYWLQTDAPRPDGSTGWPGLRLRPDVVGTSDGFAKQPYIRESRRIRAQRTVVEQDVSIAASGDAAPARTAESVGVGAYRIDLHPSTGGDPYLDIAARPFEIPLGALLPVRLRNLLPAAKNLGTTHITNGCYRLHPVEWNVGEAAGMLAAYCLEHGTEPTQVRAERRHLEAFQTALTHSGVELHWPDVRGY